MRARISTMPERRPMGRHWVCGKIGRDGVCSSRPLFLLPSGEKTVFHTSHFPICGRRADKKARRSLFHSCLCLVRVICKSGFLRFMQIYPDPAFRSSRRQAYSVSLGKNRSPFSTETCINRLDPSERKVSSPSFTRNRKLVSGLVSSFNFSMPAFTVHSPKAK